MVIALRGVYTVQTAFSSTIAVPSTKKIGCIIPNVDVIVPDRDRLLLLQDAQTSLG